MLLVARHLLLERLRFFCDLLQLSLELDVLLAELRDKLVLLLVVDDQVGHFPLVLRNEELLRFDLVPQVILDRLVRILVQYELP